MKIFPWRMQISKEKHHTSATNVSIYPLQKAPLEVILKSTTEKSHTNAINVTMHLPIQVRWEHIWKRTAEKNQTNATNVNMSLLRQAVWRDIWKCTVEKSQTNATNVETFEKTQMKLYKLSCTQFEYIQGTQINLTLPFLRLAIWGDQNYTELPPNLTS